MDQQDDRDSIKRQGVQAIRQLEDEWNKQPISIMHENRINEIIELHPPEFIEPAIIQQGICGYAERCKSAHRPQLLSEPHQT